MEEEEKINGNILLRWEIMIEVVFSFFNAEKEDCLIENISRTANVMFL